MNEHRPDYYDPNRYYAEGYDKNGEYWLVDDGLGIGDAPQEAYERLDRERTARLERWLREPDKFDCEEFTSDAEFCLEDVSRVYAFLMSNGTVKIGITRDVSKRQASISKASGLKVIKLCSSWPLLESDARAVEKHLHKVFADNRLSGEYFAITFEQAHAELKRLFGEIPCEVPPDVARWARIFKHCGISLDSIVSD